MPNILITGPAGSGKSYLAKRWAEKGIKTIDGDAMTDVCRWFDQNGNRTEFPDDISLADAAWFKAHTFTWDPESLKKFLTENHPIIVLGTCDNITQIIQYFDRAHYLSIPFAVARERLLSPERQAFTAFGQHEEQRAALEKMIADSDKAAEDLGMTILDATLSADELLHLVSPQ